MTEEIKEILEDLGNKDNYIEEYGYQYKRISLYESFQLLNYITNLQEENKILRGNTDLVNLELIAYKNELEDRIDKAIEYVENHKFNKFGDIDCGEAEKIINILQGSDEE